MKEALAPAPEIASQHCHIHQFCNKYIITLSQNIYLAYIFEIYFLKKNTTTASFIIEMVPLVSQIFKCLELLFIFILKYNHLSEPLKNKRKINPKKRLSYFYLLSQELTK